MTRHIIVCPTAFKGTISASAAARAMAAGAEAAVGERVTGQVRMLPLSDGGDGLLDALRAAAGGVVKTARVSGPLGRGVSASYLVQEDRVVVETAEACGLHLVPEPLRDPMTTSTRGVGELLLAARGAAGVSGAPVVVGLGGSATVDAGAGMAAALGWRLVNARGEPIASGGEGLLSLHVIQTPRAPPPLGELVVLADVGNPLLGPNGAAPVYAPQKGASPSQVETLARGLERWVEVVRRDVGADVGGLERGGAAGGLGAAFAALLGTPLLGGADWLLEAVGFDALLERAALVITGEGAWDAQSSMGKIVGEVVTRCRAARVPVMVVTGSADAHVPVGVEVVTGGGRALDERSIAALVEDRARGLLA